MSAKGISRRALFRLGAMSASMALLAACAPASKQEASPTSSTGAESEATKAPAGEATPAPKEAVALTIWMSDWGKDWNDPMLTLNDAFIQDAMPTAKIEMTFMPSLTEKLAAAIVGGNPPDVAVIDESYAVPKMALATGLIPLKEYYDKDGVKGEDFIGFTWETVLFKGEPYGMPGGAGVKAIFYDKKVWQEAGIDVSQIPDTPSWDQFVEWNNKLLKKDENGKIQRFGYLGGDLYLWVGLLGMEYYDAAKSKLILNSEQNVAALERYLSSLIPQDVPFEDISNLAAGAPTTQFGTWGAGVEAMLMDGYWSFLAIDKYWPDIDYGITKWPTPHGQKEEWDLYAGWVWDVAIPKGAKHPNEGWEFIKYGYWSHGERLADTLNWTSSLKCFDAFVERTRKIMGEDNREAPYLHHFAEMQYAGKAFIPWTPVHAKLIDGLSQLLDAVRRKQQTVKDALDELVSTLQPELDKAQGTF